MAGVSMHSEWGVLEVNFSKDYSDHPAAFEDPEWDTTDPLLLLVPTLVYAGIILVIAAAACARPTKFRWWNNSFGQLRCCCCHGAHRDGRSSACWAVAWARSAHWSEFWRFVTVDAVVVAMDWSFMVWSFYALTLAMLMIVFWLLVQTGVKPARATGWLCIAALSLLLFPVGRDSPVLKLLRLPFDRAVAHHRLLGRVFLFFEIAHAVVVTRDWGVDVGNAHEAFGAGNVIPVWGWVAFAVSCLIGITSIHWVRRRAFEVRACVCVGPDRVAAAVRTML